MGTLVLVKTAALIGTGFCFGIGFWASKKITNIADEWLLLYDQKQVNRLSQEMNLSSNL